MSSTDIGERDQDRPVRAEIKAGMLLVTLEDGRMIRTPLVWYPVLMDASSEELAQVELLDDGVRWPVLDEDLSVKGMLKGNRPPAWKRGEWQERLGHIKARYSGAER